MRYAVIFDLDGVLVDTYQTHFDSWQMLCRQWDLSMTESQFAATFGRTTREVVAEFFLPADVDTKKAKAIAFRAAAVSKYAYLNKPIAVIFKNEMSQGRSYLKMRLKAYVLDIRFAFPFASEMTELVLGELTKQGIQCQGG